jgi:hypothetical protein
LVWSLLVWDTDGQTSWWYHKPTFNFLKKSRLKWKYILPLYGPDAFMCIRREDVSGFYVVQRFSNCGSRLPGGGAQALKVW